MKAYGYLIDCVAGMANIDRDTRLRIFKHVIDESNVPSWKAVQFEELLGYPRRMSSPEPVVESKSQPVAPVAQAQPAESPKPKVYPTIAEMEEAIVVKQRELDAFLRRTL